MENLSPKMKERLEKWRKHTISVANTSQIKQRKQTFVAQRDYGDDFRDIEKKQDEAWAKELQNNPIYRGYR